MHTNTHTNVMEAKSKTNMNEQEVAMNYEGTGGMCPAGERGKASRNKN